MNRSSRAVAALVLALSLAPAAFADDAAIRKNISERIPQFPKIDEITKTPIPGLYELRIGTDIYYTDEQGNYIIEGQLVDTKTRVNLTEERIAKLTAIDFKTLPLKDAMVWKQGTGERKLVVFADPNCGYCKKFEKRPAGGQGRHRLHLPLSDPRRRFAREVEADLVREGQHQDLARLDDQGHADHRQPGSATRSALQRNFALGQKHRIRGTPGLVFEDGRTQAGAMNTEQIEKQLVATRRRRPS